MWKLDSLKPSTLIFQHPPRPPWVRSRFPQRMFYFFLHPIICLSSATLVVFSFLSALPHAVPGFCVFILHVKCEVSSSQLYNGIILLNNSLMLPVRKLLTAFELREKTTEKLHKTKCTYMNLKWQNFYSFIHHLNFYLNKTSHRNHSPILTDTSTFTFVVPGLKFLIKSFVFVDLFISHVIDV